MNTLKLSEAIRLGSMMRPQCFEDYYRNGGSCALGAALEAVGHPFGNNHPGREEDRWPILLTVDAMPCPEHCGQPMFNAITHLNDFHRWPRERIADWVESIEKQQEAVQPVPTSCWDCSERIEDGVHDCVYRGEV